MATTMRIDKFLANKAIGSRKEVHKLVSSGVVTVNGQVIRDKALSVNPETDEIAVNGAIINGRQQYYVKFHKPAGYICAVEDATAPTVMDLLPPEFLTMKVSPVGRLDKDTEGLLLLTNDGVWGHTIINGRKKVPKVYHATYEGTLTEEGIQRIREGIRLGDGTQCKPASIESVAPQTVALTIEEGKYHQVKRMIGAAGGTVSYLKRLSIGPLTLTGIEQPGQFAFLTAEEMTALTIALQKDAKASK